jgi:hypothetical protein
LDGTLLGIGIACVIAAIVGGGLKAFGVEIPALSSVRRQILLAICGVFLALGSMIRQSPRAPDRSDPSLPHGTTGDLGQTATATNERTPTFNAKRPEATVQSETVSGAFEISENTDRPQFNLPTAVASTDLESCENACLNNNECKGFVIRKPGNAAEGCYLKSAIDPQVRQDPCCTTGTRRHFELRATFVDDFLDCSMDGYPLERIGFHHSGTVVRNLDPYLRKKGVHELRCVLIDIAGTDGHPCWGWAFEVVRNDEVIKQSSSGDECHPGAHDRPREIDPLKLTVD